MSLKSQISFHDKTHYSSIFQTTEANNNRITTNIRSIVEAINGRIKQFHYFNKVIPNIALPYIYIYMTIYKLRAH